MTSVVSGSRSRTSSALRKAHVAQAHGKSAQAPTGWQNKQERLGKLVKHKPVPEKPE